MFKTEPLFSSAATPGSGKNLNNLLADDGEEGEQEPPGLIQQFLNFWSKLWSPSTSDAEKLGWSYVYAEDGSLLGEYGSGGSASSGTSQYIYLPTASGPMPIAAVIKGQTYAIHSDHLNTPRKLTQADGQAEWQWAYSAFGEEQPTTGAKRFTNETTTPTTGSTSIPEVTFNLRYPGQYFDSETKLHDNWNRTYDSRTGRYTQGDPVGLDGGWNRFSYVGGNPLKYADPSGLDNHGMGPYAPPLPVSYCYGQIRTYDHAYICSGDNCAGLMPADMSWFYGRGRIMPEKKNPDLCKPMDVPPSCSQSVYENCIANKAGQSGQSHPYGLLTYNCVSWARDAILQCQQEACGK